MRLTVQIVTVVSLLWLAVPAEAQVVGADGSVSYSYSFPLPPARGRYQPTLSISYNSNSGMSAVGLGWALNENYVEVSSRATPALTGQPRARYFLALNGAKQLIVPASDGSYRPDISDTYLSLTRTNEGWTGTDAVGNAYTYSCLLGQQLSCTRWYLLQVVDVDGNKTTYNYNKPGSIETLIETQQCPNSSVSPSRTAALLTSISYNYNSAGTAIHSVGLSYDSHPPSGPQRDVEAIGECLVTHDKLLSSIQIARAQPGTPSSSVTLASYDLVQKQKPSNDTGRWLLDHIQLRDRGGSPVGLATSFNYEADLPNVPLTDPPTPTPGPALASLAQRVIVGLPSSPFNNLESYQCYQWGATVYNDALNCGVQHLAAWLDMDGDGLPDLVWGGYDDPSFTAPAPPGTPPPPCKGVSGATCTRQSGIRWARNLTRPGDGTGSVAFGTPQLISSSATWKGAVFFTNASGSKEVADDATYYPNSRYGTSRLIDVNGDGLPDLVLAGAAAAADCNSSPNVISLRLAQVDASGGLSYAPALCADVSAARNEFQTQYRNPNTTLGPAANSLPVTYRAVSSTSSATRTILELVDLTGDGLPDFVLVVGSEWHVYPGHGTTSGGWAFGTNDPSTPYLRFVPLTPSSSSGQMSIRETDADGNNVATLEDVNGDGLMDRISASPTGAPYPQAAWQWTVDYNTGTAFAATGSAWYQGTLPPGLTTQSPYGTPISSDVMLLDLNRDGRPDFVLRQDAPCTPPSTPGIVVRFNQGGGLTSWTFMPQPDEYCSSGRTFSPYGEYNGSGWNEMFVDFDGDGILDYVHSGVYNIPTLDWTQWSFFRGRQLARRPDLLTSVVSSTGLTTNIQWGPSSDHGVVQHVPLVSDVVSSISMTGPALSPLTTSYAYASPAYTKIWDDPSQMQIEPLGFGDRYEMPSVGGFVQHAQFGTSHLTAGLPILTETLPANNGNIPPSNTAFLKQQMAWSARQVGALDCAASNFPAFRYLTQNTTSRIEASATLQSTLTNGCPDTNGNVTQTTVTRDVATNDTVVVNRVFSSASACVNCLLEEWGTASPPAGDLFHRYYHYDVPGFAPDAGHSTTLVTGRLAYVEHLVSGSGPSGVYEFASIALYNANGTVNGARNFYTGQNVDTVTVAYSYDLFSNLERTGETVSDLKGSVAVSAPLTTAYKWNAYGDLIERDGPSASATPTAPVISSAYDNLGRLIAVAAKPIAGGVVAQPLAAFEYVEPTTQTPGSRRTYTFSWDPSAPEYSYAISGGAPNTNDVIQSIQYLDPLGRTIQTRTRLGTGNAGTSSNVIRGLPLQYRVTGNGILDGLGRVTSVLDPYFASTSSYVDPRGGAELSTPGLHGTSVAYDAKSRKVCEWYVPVLGSIPAAPTDPTLCTSDLSETANYRRATALSYGVDTSIDAPRPYFIVDLMPDWNSNRVSVRTYLDAAGRVRYQRAGSGTTYEEIDYDLMSRPVRSIRWAGLPHSSGVPSVTSSWIYDLRGRVSMEDSGAGGKRWYSYLPTGQVSLAIRNATQTIADDNAVWTTQLVGTLGRVVQIDKHRFSITSSCNARSEVIDTTTLQYDTPFAGQETDRYAPAGSGVLAGRLTALLGSAATIAIGYDARGMAVLRDEWTGEAGVRNTVSDAYGGDGRLLSRSFGSPYLANTITYTVGYDSMGHPVQLTGTGATVYWQAGTGGVSTDPSTGPYDALNRLTTTKWDSGLGTTTRNFYANSNLPSGYSTTVPGAAGSSLTVYATQNMTWQGSRLAGYTVMSNWEGVGTSYAAHYDTDGHLRDWSAAPLGALGSATQQFNETYAFGLENLATITATNNLGLSKALTYSYDQASLERLTSISVQSAGIADYLDYDRRGRGLITAHRVSALQSPPQDGYEYDADGRLTSISHLGAKVEDLAYGPDGELVSRQFANGTDTARFYVGDHLTLVRRGTTTIGYAHIYLGSTRVASVWSKSTGGSTTTGTLYYHRNEQRSIVATTTMGGEVGISYRYLPSGAIDKTTGSEVDENASELGYTGGLKLSGGLIHLKARVYSPALRRFLQPDTLDLRRYTYANSDPLNFVDPSGRGGVVGEVCLPVCPKADGGNGGPGNSGEGNSGGGSSGGGSSGGGNSGPGTSDNGGSGGTGGNNDGNGTGDTGRGPGANGDRTPGNRGNNGPSTSGPPAYGPGLFGAGVFYGAANAGQYSSMGATGGGGDQGNTRPQGIPAPPTFRWRLPDFVSLSASVTIPTPWTGTLLSWTISVSADRYGNWYWSPIGPGFGKAPTAVAGSLTANWLVQDYMPGPTQLSDFLSGHGATGSAGYFGGGNVAWSPGNGFAYGVGIMTPQAGANYSYSFPVGSTGVKW